MAHAPSATADTILRMLSKRTSGTTESADASKATLAPPSALFALENLSNCWFIGVLLYQKKAPLSRSFQLPWHKASQTADGRIMRMPYALGMAYAAAAINIINIAPSTTHTTLRQLLLPRINLGLLRTDP
jgi:hypothetical protein